VNTHTISSNNVAHGVYFEAV